MFLPSSSMKPFTRHRLAPFFPSPFWSGLPFSCFSFYASSQAFARRLRDLPITFFLLSQTFADVSNKPRPLNALSPSPSITPQNCTRCISLFPYTLWFSPFSFFDSPSFFTIGFPENRHEALPCSEFNNPAATFYRLRTAPCAAGPPANPAFPLRSVDFFCYQDGLVPGLIVPNQSKTVSLTERHSPNKHALKRENY